jgi:hypothetical protein
MASYNYTFTSGDTVTPTKLNSARTVSEIVNADIKSDAAIAGTKIAPNFGAQALTAGAGSIIAGNTSTDALRITQEGAGNALVVEDSANPDSTPLVVNSSGQIISGAATAFNPSAGLQITSDSNAAPNAVIAVRRNQDSATESAGITMLKARGTLSSPTAVVANDSLGIIGFRGHDGSSATGGNAARIEAFADGTVATNSIPARLSFQTTAVGATSATERMRITSAGNVGINTTSPTARLTVAHNDTTDAVRITQEGSGNALVVEDSTNPDATPFIVTADGNVGIGVGSSPTSKLHVGGVMTLGQFQGIQSVDRNSNTFISGGSSYDNGANIYLGGPDVAGGYLSISTGSGATNVERMRVATSGNVGINTTSPTEKLEVNGTVKATAFSGPLTGNVTGDLTGNVTGNITGNVTGTASAIADSTVTNAKVAAGAAIVDTKLATISTAGKVSNSATTATNANTASAIVARDAGGNFSAGTITASLSGNVTGNLTGTASAIADGSVSTAKIVDGNVTMAKIADANVTLAKLVTAVQQALVPAGAVQAFAMNSAPAGWLAADGTNVSRSTYAALFSAIGTTYGAGDGSTTFNLPDLRGYFVRGSGTNSDGTAAGTFGAKQADDLKSHTHSGSFLLSSGPLNLGGTGASILAPLTVGSVTATGGTETRPANIAMLYCIKF